MGIEESNNDDVWNEAQFKMIRLHKIQTELNVAWMTPLEKNDHKTFYYMVIFDLINRLYKEGESEDYSDEEKKEVDDLKLTIENLLSKFPIHSIKINNGYNGTRRVDVFNESNWSICKPLLELFERKVRGYNAKHGLSNKRRKQTSGRSILR